MIEKLPRAFSVLALAAVMAAPLSAQAADAALSDAQKAEVKSLVEQYIKENPEVIIESFKAYQEKQQQDSLKAAQESISKNTNKLTAKGLPGTGNPDGDITVVEFFDYNCGYCKKVITDIQSILDSDKNVRFVFFDMPILGESSLTAAKWAQAAHKQGKYFEFHTALMEHRGSIDNSVLESAAKKSGLDVAKLKKDAESDEIAVALENALTLGRDVGVQGTPGFVIGGELFPGYLGEDGLKQAIKDAREKKKN